jgi:proteasome lid subunit RPN8/RPN11
LARASTQIRERVWTLVGSRRGRIWCARCVKPLSGEPTRVKFDGPWALKREEQRHDVVGFLHTHPGMLARPSCRDLRTIRAWCSAFGKPLLCLIAGSDGLRAYRFDDHESPGVELKLVEKFPRGLIVVMDE